MSIAARWLCGAALALFVPFLIVAFLIQPLDLGAVPSRIQIPWFVIWAGLCIPGIVGIHVLPLGRGWKGALTALYVPACLFATAMFSLWFACAFNGACV